MRSRAFPTVSRNEVRLDDHVRIETPDRLRCALHLGAAEIGRAVDHLPLQIREAHRIVVHDADGADPGRGEILDQRRAEAPGADHEDASAFKLLLAGAAHILENEVAGITVDFVR